MSTLDELRKHSAIAIDTADLNEYGKIPVEHATTNPSLISSVANGPYLELAISYGREILKKIPGHVSIQLDPRLSFDVEGSIIQAEKIIQSLGSDRILIKIPGTWEGIQTVKQLERKKIRCNVTIIVSLIQALAAAEAGASCIAAYVGRVSDWYHQENKGVELVVSIHNALKSYGFSTKVMAASFQSLSQITQLCGLDIFTFKPKLLQQLASSSLPAPKILSTPPLSTKPIPISEKSFRWQLCNDACASFLLDDAIRKFSSNLT
jgi:transaldolase